MFKRLLFGNEEKLQFKTSATDGIARLYSQANIPASDVRYWRSYVRLFDSPSDVFTLLSVADVRRALIRHPENVVTLVKVLVTHLEDLEDDPEFSPAPVDSNQSDYSSASAGLGRLSSQASSSAFSLVNDGARRAAALGTLLGGGSGGDLAQNSSSSQSAAQRDRAREALNCCRILTRVLPIVLEGDHDASSNVQADGSQQQGASLDSNEFENNLLWSPQQMSSDQENRIFPPRSGSSKAPNDDKATEDQFIIEDDDDEDDLDQDSQIKEDSREKPSETTSQQADDGSKTTLGERLTRSIVHLLFYAGFTVPWAEEENVSSISVADSRIHYIIWEKGIGNSSEMKGKTKAMESNRLELMRLLLTLLSKSMFVTPNAQQSTDNHALRILTHGLGKGVILPLLCSLLNLSVVQSKDSSWIGNLTSIPVGLVNDKLSGVEDVRQTSTTIALQLLNIALAYEGLKQADEHIAGTNGTVTPSLNTYSAPGTPIASRPILSSALSSLSIASTKSAHEKASPQNLFRFYISKLHRQSDFHLLADGILAVLGQRPNAASLLNSTTSVQGTDTSAAGPHIPETLLLLWRLLWHNVRFRTFILEEHSPELLSNLLFHALNNKDSAARQGLVRLAIFILHDISCDRSFAVNICKAGSGAKARITGGQRWGVAVGGGTGNNAVSTGRAASGQSSQASTGADILIQAVYALIATTKSTLSALYAPLVITLTNVSPYFKNLSIFSANRLLSLFSSFSNASFLLADEGNPRVLFYLIESLNCIVQYGFQRNANVIYAIVRSHRSIERLASFTLRRGIADVRRSRKRNGLMGTVISSPRNEIPQTPPSARDSATALSTAPPAQDLEMIEQDKIQSKRDDVQSLERASEATSGGTIAEPQPASEKARGKMRRSSTSDDLQAQDGSLRNTLSAQDDEEDDLVNGFNDQELFLAASMIGREGFVPSQNWVTSWHKGLPLDVLQIAVVELVPKVQELCDRVGSKPDADERVLAWLREQNLEAVLPPVISSASGGASSPQPRSFKWTSQVSVWLLSYIWGLVYVTSTMPYGLFNGSNARLFQLRLQDGNSSTSASARASMSINRSVAADVGTANNASGGMTRPSLSLNSLASTSMMQRNGSATSLASPRISDASASLAEMGSSMLGGISSVFGLGLQSQSPQMPPVRSSLREDREATI